MRLPAGTKILERLMFNRGGSADVPEGRATHTVRVGIPWAPEEFVAEAKKLTHPFSDQAFTSDR
eukprot:14317401-Heterocapsa_arctica.AAC.1